MTAIHDSTRRAVLASGSAGTSAAAWRTFEATDCGHDVMVDAPQWLVDVLLQVS